MRPHGYSRYQLYGCRCYVCAWANSQYQADRKEQIAAGTWRPFADARPVREHLATLGKAGLGGRRIAELSGLSYSAIRGIMHGYPGSPPTTEVRRETAEAILALDVTKVTPATRGLVDGTGTARRVQALCAIGWSLTTQARRVGWEAGNFADLAKGCRVRPETARRVDQLYDQLSMTPAPASASATRARRMAATRGWAPPLAWDDDKIDNPDASPATGTSNRTRHGTRSSEDFVADYQLLVDLLGQDKHRVAERLGMTLAAVQRQVLRARAAGLLEAVAA